MADREGAKILAALHTLYESPDGAAKKVANDFLEEFQHSVRRSAYRGGVVHGMSRER